VFPVRRSCPANCNIEAAENTDTNRISAGERYARLPLTLLPASLWLLRVRPTDAITHGHGFELAPLRHKFAGVRKEQMLKKIFAERPCRSLTR
jgi:NADH-quinone oxidoreductase subunit I